MKRKGNEGENSIYKTNRRNWNTGTGDFSGLDSFPKGLGWG
jgi:hypothetical protein